VRQKLWQTAKECHTQAFLIGNNDIKVLPSYLYGYWWHFLGCLVFAGQCSSSR